MNKWKRFEWTEECVLAFKQLKEYISWPPIMSSPKIDKALFTYIVVANYTGRIAKCGTILGVFDIKNFYSERYMLMVQRIKGDTE